MQNNTCLIAEQVKVVFKVKGFARAARQLIAVNDVSFGLRYGETISLIGESGSGKTTVGRVIVGLTKPTSGTVRFITKDRREIVLSTRWPRHVRRCLQMVFQDPYSSLNPRMRVSQILEEGMINYKLCGKRQAAKRIINLLEMVGLDASFLRKYPNEMSGGERQRIAIARAISVEPMIIVCDEVVSALDVSTQVVILQLLKDLQQRLGLTYLFITHDLYVARYLSGEILVMYQGRILERGPADEIMSEPAHPYTKSLIKSALNIDAEKETIHTSEDFREDLCPFRQRCKYQLEICNNVFPQENHLTSEHRVFCHLYSR